MSMLVTWHPRPANGRSRARSGRSIGAASWWPSTAVAGVVVGVMWVVRSLPDSGCAPAALALVLGLLVIPVVASPIEWFVHRFVYHEAVIRPLGAIFTVHTAHHYAFFPTWRYVTGGPARRLSIGKRTPDANASPRAKRRGAARALLVVHDDRCGRRVAAGVAGDG